MLCTQQARHAIITALQLNVSESKCAASRLSVFCGLSYEISNLYRPSLCKASGYLFIFPRILYACSTVTVHTILCMEIGMVTSWGRGKIIWDPVGVNSIFMASAHQVTIREGRGISTILGVEVERYMQSAGSLTMCYEQ